MAPCVLLLRFCTTSQLFLLVVCRTRSPSSFFGERSRSAGPPSAMPQQTAATAAEPAALLPVRVAVRCWRETAADGEPCVVV